MAVISPASLIAIADTIEVSNGPAQVALYRFTKVETDNGFRGVWIDGSTNHSGTTAYALIDLAQRAGLQVAAWKDGERVW